MPGACYPYISNPWANWHAMAQNAEILFI